MGNLQQTINWAKTYSQYVPSTAGLGQEPAVSIASMIRASMLNPPMTWYFNRAEKTFPTQIGLQDYQIAVPDLAFVENVSLLDDEGNIWQLKDVYNNAALSKSSSQQRPSAMSVESTSIVNGALTFLFRFMGVPEKVYTVTVVYQKMATMFGPFFITSASAASNNNTTYTGTFDPLSFPAGSKAVITGFVTNPANNGSFVVVSCSTTQLVVANGAGVAEAISAFANNFSWDPIPDQYRDVYNNLFLAEIMAVVDDAKSQLYRQRGVAALLSKATGLTEMQKNAFAQQWLARDVERAATLSMVDLGTRSRAV